jgi:hypothetical protein
MSKLHELLAVDANLKGQAQKCRTELQSTLEKKRHLFAQKLVTFTPLAEGAPAETREQSDIQTTVKKEVEWLSNIIKKAVDASYAIDVANTTAKADVVLEDGTTLLKDVPATALLQLEKRVKEVSEFIHTIPTLDPAKGFEPDTSREAGIYKAREVLKSSTQKIQEPLTLSPATKEHPAQVQLVTKDVKVGTIQELEWSSLITPALKADLLERSEALFRAITQARSRANDIEVDAKSHKIGKKLLEYVFSPLA